MGQEKKNQPAQPPEQPQPAEKAPSPALSQKEAAALWKQQQEQKPKISDTETKKEG
jgi:hypothetical protein